MTKNEREEFMRDKTSATKHKQAFENCKLFYSINDEQIEKYYKNLETPENDGDYFDTSDFL